MPSMQWNWGMNPSLPDSKACGSFHKPFLPTKSKIKGRALCPSCLQMENKTREFKRTAVPKKQTVCPGPPWGHSPPPKWRWCSKVRLHIMESCGGQETVAKKGQGFSNPWVISSLQEGCFSRRQCPDPILKLFTANNWSRYRSFKGRPPYSISLSVNVKIPTFF